MLIVGYWLALAGLVLAGCTDGHLVAQASPKASPPATTTGVPGKALTTPKRSAMPTRPTPAPAHPTSAEGSRGPAPLPPPPGGGPLTGLAGPSGVPARPALVVKIDNGPP